MIRWIRDLRATGEAIDDQEFRAVCLSLSMTNAHEHEIQEPLSVEYLRWSSGNYGQRGSVSATAQALEDKGQPPKNQWAFFQSTDEAAATYVLPSTVTGPFRRAQLSDLIGFDEVEAAIRAGHRVILAVHTSPDWYLRDTTVITRGLPVRKNHAVVAVAVGVMEADVGGWLRNGDRVLVIRNSWGSSWGLNGHAMMTEGAFSTSVHRSLLVTPS